MTQAQKERMSRPVVFSSSVCWSHSKCILTYCHDDRSFFSLLLLCLFICDTTTTNACWVNQVEYDPLSRWSRTVGICQLFGGKDDITGSPRRHSDYSQNWKHEPASGQVISSCYSYKLYFIFFDCMTYGKRRMIPLQDPPIKTNLPRLTFSDILPSSSQRSSTKHSYFLFSTAISDTK